MPYPLMNIMNTYLVTPPQYVLQLRPWKFNIHYHRFISRTTTSAAHCLEETLKHGAENTN